MHYKCILTIIMCICNAFVIMSKNNIASSILFHVILLIISVIFRKNIPLPAHPAAGRPSESVCPGTALKPGQPKAKKSILIINDCLCTSCLIGYRLKIRCLFNQECFYFFFGNRGDDEFYLFRVINVFMECQLLPK